jgi:hypothetical protein
MSTQPTTQTKTTDSQFTDTRKSDTSGMLIIDRGRASDKTKGFPFGPYYEAGPGPFFQVPG